MNRQMEGFLILALSALTLSTTFAFIHNESRPKHELSLSPLVARTERFLHPLGSLLVHRNKTDAVSLKPNRQQTARFPVNTASSKARLAQAVPAETGASSVLNGWSQTDVQHFLGIVQKLTHSVTPSDLQKVQSALNGKSETQAQAALMSVANQYLSSADEAWLAAHLSGDKPFGPTDVKLLQQALKEFQTELTPAEQQLMKADKQ